MKNILESVMSARWTAVLTALALVTLSLLPVLKLPCIFLALGLVALVGLSRDPGEASLVCLSAMLPIVLSIMVTAVRTAAGSPAENPADSGYQALFSLAPFPWVLVCALYLSGAGSWSRTLAANTGCALLYALALQWLAGDFLDYQTGELRQTLEQILQQGREQIPEGDQQSLQMLTGQRYAVMYSNAIALFALLSLLLGRYWQAMLYNPGGLRRELHRLRLPPTLAWTLVALWLTLLLLARYNGLGYDWTGYETIFRLPLLFAGLALVHALAVRWNAGFWLIFFYVMLILIPPLRSLLALTAVADSQWDLRSQFNAYPHSPLPGRDNAAENETDRRRDSEEKKED